jgi:hypothetical protein
MDAALSEPSQRLRKSWVTMQMRSGARSTRVGSSDLLKPRGVLILIRGDMGLSHSNQPAKQLGERNYYLIRGGAMQTGALCFLSPFAASRRRPGQSRLDRPPRIWFAAGATIAAECRRRLIRSNAGSGSSGNLLRRPWSIQLII